MTQNNDDSANELRAGGGGKQLFVKPELRDEAINKARLMSGQAWNDFCDAIKRSGEHMLAMDIDWDELGYVDVFIYLAGIVNGGIRTAIDHADPGVPKWVNNGNGIKHSGDNPDNRYLITDIDPTKEYRIYGKRENCSDIMFELSEGYMQMGESRTFATLSFNQAFTVDPDGSFEIIASAKEREGNWLPLDPDSKQLRIRLYFLDWEKEVPPSIAIEQIGHEGLPPAPVGAARMAEILDYAAAWIESNAMFWPPWSEDLYKKSKTGVFEQAHRVLGGSKDIYYGFYAYQLEEGEALIMEAVVPPAKYWSFQMQTNSFASMDFHNHQTSLNCRQIKVDDDGKFRIVIAHEDPRVANWLDTCGRKFAVVLWRWAWAEKNTDVSLQRTTLAKLFDRLPADTSRVSAEERRKTIAIRQRHFALRERSCG